MTTYRVDPEQVLALGAGLADLAESLALMGDPAQDRSAMGPGEVGPALETLLGGWRRARTAVAADLARLADATVDAGGLYLDTETGAHRAFDGGPRR